MSDTFAYKTATAFDAALKAHVAEAAEASSHTVGEIRRQFGYDRLLSRIFSTHAETWILKGGTGMLARLPSRARHTQDIDLYFQGELTAASENLLAAAAIDLGDFFSFAIEPRSELAGASRGKRFAVTAYVGARQFTQFGIDVVVASNMTGEPESMQHLSPIPIAGLPTANYRVYPIVDHIADKHAAMLGTYNDDRPSTRFRDLVDLVLIATTQRPRATELRAAMMSEYTHRSLTAPAEVTLPSAAWHDGYAKAVGGIPGLRHRTADAALDVVKKMLDPVLAELATGVWDPNALAWREDPGRRHNP